MTKGGLFKVGLRHNTTQPSHDTTGGALATRCPAPKTRPAGAYDPVRHGRLGAPRYGHPRALGYAGWAWLGALCT